MDAAHLSVLFAPAHTRVDESSGGSEYNWPYKLIERLARDSGVQGVALTMQPHVEHQIPGVEFVTVSPDEQLPVSPLESLRFHLHCYAATRRLLAGGHHFDVVHHVLPFGFRATFSPFALRRRATDPPLVIGPLQPPLAFLSHADARVAARDFTAPTAPSEARARRSAVPALSTFVTTPVLSALSAATLRRAEALVAVSPRAARLYGSLAGRREIDVIPPGVDTTAFSPQPRQGNDDAPVTILAAGYLMRRKAFDVLIQAVGRLASSGLAVRLRLVGDGPIRADLESLIHSLGLRAHVELAGLVPHGAMVHEYRRADIFCSTSLSEGFATVALEALACGLPLVATPAGGFYDVLRQHDVGILVPFGSVDDLTAALTTLVQDRARRVAMGRRARDVAVREYDWSAIAARYLAIYLRTLRRSV